MDNKVSNIKERILKYTDFKGLPKEKFFSEIGMTYGSFKGKAKERPLNSDAIENIISNYLDINIEWLLTGKGDMIKQSVNSAISLVNNPETIENRIPLVYGTAIGGFGGGSFSIAEKDVKAYYVIPKFKHKRIDFMIEVEGSSMYPKYNSGDVIACTIINESGFIQWNKTHVVATKHQGLIVKRIKKGTMEENLCMVSDNKQYDPFEIPKDEIDGIALVAGVIRLE